MSQNNWHPIDVEQYSRAYQQFGGSISTHPDVIATMSFMIDTEVSYKASYRHGKIVAAIPTWKNFIAGDRRYLREINRQKEFDFSNTEVALPIAPHTKIHLNIPCNNLSELNLSSVENAVSGSSELCFAKNMSTGGFSKKFISKHKRLLRMFKDNGGSIELINQLCPQQVVYFYLELFSKRWGKQPAGHQRLSEFLNSLRKFLFGYVLLIEERAISIQLVLLTETSRCISAAYINGGFDPEYCNYSPGNILTFLNLKAASECAVRTNKPLRYSFGIPDQKYKDSWCFRQPVYQC